MGHRPFERSLTLSHKQYETEIEKLLHKGAIVRTDRETGDFISPIFLRKKKDGSHCMILNLKALNKTIVYHHFKMDTLGSVIQLMRPNCFMATIDLKDAYYSVPVTEKHQKYLKFHWKGNFYKFTCFPNGLFLLYQAHKASPLSS